MSWEVGIWGSGFFGRGVGGGECGAGDVVGEGGGGGEVWGAWPGGGWGEGLGREEEKLERMAGWRGMVSCAAVMGGHETAS